MGRLDAASAQVVALDVGFEGRLLDSRGRLSPAVSVGRSTSISMPMKASPFATGFGMLQILVKEGWWRWFDFCNCFGGKIPATIQNLYLHFREIHHRHAY